MPFRSIGRSGIKVSPICIGTFNFGDPTPEDEALAIVERAVAGGIFFFDTSNNYNAGVSETILGRALKRLGDRHQVVVASKAHFPVGPGPNDFGNSRLHLMRACEDSLRRLGVDYIDLYQLHRPSFNIPVEETLGAMRDLITQGKIRYIGVSTHPAWKVMEAILVSDLKGYPRIISEQPPYNLLDRRIENELVPLCQAYGVGLIPYAPLAQGVLAGRYHDDEAFPPNSRAALRGGIYAGRVNRTGIEIGSRFSSLARQHGLTPAQLALLWSKEQPAITAPIFGPRTVAQLEEVLPVLEMRLSDQMREACDALVPPGTAVTDFHNGCDWMLQKVGAVS